MTSISLSPLSLLKHTNPFEMAKILLEKYKIWTVAIDYANVHGVRVTPHLFTTTDALDALVKALKELA